MADALGLGPPQGDALPPAGDRPDWPLASTTRAGFCQDREVEGRSGRVRRGGGDRARRCSTAPPSRTAWGTSREGSSQRRRARARSRLDSTNGSTLPRARPTLAAWPSRSCNEPSTSGRPEAGPDRARFRGARRSPCRGPPAGRRRGHGRGRPRGSKPPGCVDATGPARRRSGRAARDQRGGRAGGAGTRRGWWRAGGRALRRRAGA